ncbi:hypothetical protein HDV01_000776 [Terramyces sp. JEL0728]|nr:hypothetical protein HDV01_000776 [Terramyces sp. JEL0728]
MQGDNTESDGELYSPAEHVQAGNIMQKRGALNLETEIHNFLGNIRTEPEKKDVKFNPHKERLAEIDELDRNPNISPISISSGQNMAAGRFLHENFGEKLKFTNIVYVNIVFQLLLGYMLYSLYTGFLFPISSQYAELLAVIVLFMLFVFAVWLTKLALTRVSAVSFAILLTSKSGFSLSSCVFLQLATYEKYQFTKSLSLNSISRRTLEKVSLVFVLLDGLNLLSLLTAFGVFSEELRSTTSDIKCVTFVEEGALTDKGFPTLNYAMGAAGYSFSAAIGDFRADYVESFNDPNNYSLFLMPPIILDTVSDHQQVIGDGFSVKIYSECMCVKDDDYGKFQLFTELQQVDFNQLINGYRASIPNYGLSSITLLNQNSIEVVSVFSGPTFCGGIAINNLPICKTKIHDYHHAQVMVTVKTDGTPSSISVTASNLISQSDTGDLSWLYFAMTRILNNSTLALPRQSNGLINPLLKWTTEDLQFVSTTLVGQGMEVLFAYILKAGIQRTYKPRGGLCTSFEISDKYATLYIAFPSFMIGLLQCVIIIIVSLLQGLACIKWYRGTSPIFPAIRLSQEKAYFSSMVNSSAVFENADDLCNAENFTIWQGLDKTVRLGEDLGTLDEPLVGNIIISKPKFVRPLINGRTSGCFQLSKINLIFNFEMENLPVDLIIEVSKYLPDIKSVIFLNKHWFYALIPLIWRKTDITLIELDLLKKLRRPFINYLKFIQDLSLTDFCINQKPVRLNLKLFTAFVNLTTLKVDFGLNDDEIWIITNTCKKLQSLAIKSCGRMSDEALGTICKNSNLLRLNINANNSSILTERGIHFLIDGLPNLKEFGLEYEYNFNGMSLNFGDKAAFISNICSFIEKHVLTDFSIDWPLDYTLILEKLCSRDISNIKIANSNKIDLINRVIETNPIESLNLQEINTRYVAHTMEVIPTTIKQLELDGVCHFDMLIGLVNFTCLTKLIFNATTRYASMSPYLTTKVKQIAASCQNLKIVHLPIHDDETLIEFSKCPLVELDIQDGRAVTDFGLKHLTGLQYLGLGFSNMTDPSIVDGLTSFIMATPNRISQEGFRKMNKNLEYLGNINGYTFEFVLQEIGGMKKLRKVSVGNRGGVIDRQLWYQLHRRLPKLRSLTF